MNGIQDDLRWPRMTSWWPVKLTSCQVDLILLLDLNKFPFSLLRLHYFQSFLQSCSSGFPLPSSSDLQSFQNLQNLYFSLLSEIYFEAVRSRSNHFHSFKLENQTNIYESPISQLNWQFWMFHSFNLKLGRGGALGPASSLAPPIDGTSRDRILGESFSSKVSIIS